MLVSVTAIHLTQITMNIYALVKTRGLNGSEIDETVLSLNGLRLISIITINLSIISIVPLLYLLSFHIFLMSRGVTTYQYIRQSKTNRKSRVIRKIEKTSDKTPKGGEKLMVDRKIEIKCCNTIFIKGPSKDDQQENQEVDTPGSAEEITIKDQGVYSEVPTPDKVGSKSFEKGVVVEEGRKTEIEDTKHPIISKEIRMKIAVDQTSEQYPRLEEGSDTFATSKPGRDKGAVPNIMWVNPNTLD